MSVGKGEAVRSLKKYDKELVLKMYEGMLRIRLFEQTQSKVFRAGEQEGFTHLSIGQEAIPTGVCLNLNRSDYVTSTHRGHHHMIAKGGDLKQMMAELFGRKTGSCMGRSGSLHIADFSIGVLGANGIVGDGNPIAVGAAYSIKLRKSSQVVASFFGDGASNQGTFHESLNMAASWDLPVVFVCENNLVACGVRTAEVCKALTFLGDRAVGYGIPGFNIDGNDVTEVYETVKTAVERARQRKGPTLINCMTTRQHPHWEGDKDVRSKEETEEQVRRDPVLTFEKRLQDEGIMTAAEIQQRRETIQKLVDEAVDFARKSPKVGPEDALKFVYAE
jgi:acetoin:2,6-dichlorophenolindophenol oxidoreductase subunit alpha